MRYVSLLLLTGLLVAASPTTVAQDGPVFYMTQYDIHPSRVDSLTALTQKYDIPWHNIVANNVEGYKRWHMRHDTGNEFNFMTVTMYPDWDMIRGDEIPYDDFAPQMAEAMGMTMEEMDAEEAMINPAFEWAYEGSQHMDQIWRPMARAVKSGNEDSDMGADVVAYMSQYKINPSRMDSLATLIQTYDAPWHSYVAENVEGYERYWMRHDTGNEYNLMIITVYPNWDMIDSVPFDDLFPGFAASMDMTMEEVEADEDRINAAFGWAYEGARHIDQIWRPITAGM